MAVFQLWRCHADHLKMTTKQQKTSVGVVIPAAGKGIRLGGDRPKQLLELAGKPLIVHALEYFQKTPLVESVVVVTSVDLMDAIESFVATFRLAKVVGIVEGGAERQDSVWNGLEHFVRSAPDYILIHDAVRPFPDDGVVERVLAAAEQCGAAVPAMPPKDTIKIARDDRFVISTPSRSELWAVQTPQAFRFSLIYEASRKARADGYYATDDAALVERIGEKVKIVEGNYDNIKVTTPEDRELALGIYNRRLSR
jgi:2-C-methyl-D-erythritol 4-phosphate cytidylyltransferase